MSPTDRSYSASRQWDMNVMYSTVQYSTVQFCIVLYSNAQYSAILCCTEQSSTVVPLQCSGYSTVQYSTVQYSEYSECGEECQCLLMTAPVGGAHRCQVSP